jgi:hypothetical protein
MAEVVFELAEPLQVVQSMASALWQLSSCGGRLVVVFHTDDLGVKDY